MPTTSLHPLAVVGCDRRDELPALILALVEDDDGAWEAFLACAGGLMHQAAREALDATDLIDDAIQNALLAVRDAVSGTPPSFANPAAAAAWLWVVTQNRARNLARSESVRRRRQSAAATGTATVIDAEPAGADLTTVARLRRSLATLPARQREALLMRFRDDLDNQAIAERLGCTRTQASLAIHRGLQRLRHHCLPTASALMLMALLRESMAGEADAEASQPAEAPADAARPTASPSSHAGIGTIVAALAVITVTMLVAGAPTWSLPPPIAATGPDSASTTGESLASPMAAPLPIAASDRPVLFFPPFADAYAAKQSAFDRVRLEPAGDPVETSVMTLSPVKGSFVMRQVGADSSPSTTLESISWKLPLPEGDQPLEIGFSASLRPTADVRQRIIVIGPALAEDLLTGPGPTLSTAPIIGHMPERIRWNLTLLPVGRTGDGRMVAEVRCGTPAGTVTHGLGTYEPLRLYSRQQRPTHDIATGDRASPARDIDLLIRWRTQRPRSRLRLWRCDGIMALRAVRPRRCSMVETRSRRLRDRIHR